MSNYPSDLTDLQWKAVRDCIPPGRPVGVARQVSLRAIVNALRYRRRSGCAWRLLPHDFPHWRTVYGYDREWQSDGTWRRIEQTLRELRTQVSANLLETPLSANQESLVETLVTSF
jgi:putative transposase